MKNSVEVKKKKKTKTFEFWKRQVSNFYINPQILSSLWKLVNGWSTEVEMRDYYQMLQMSYISFPNHVAKR